MKVIMIMNPTWHFSTDKSVLSFVTHLSIIWIALFILYLILELSYAHVLYIPDTVYSFSYIYKVALIWHAKVRHDIKFIVVVLSLLLTEMNYYIDALIAEYSVPYAITMSIRRFH